ncbi:DUF4355 domain-containing protein [Clostridium estertheticum]|uniref:capsid assembly scaffolding protein Gp46 family protein n=1 Tax=Clostridium estertheticum TaxID=238834 RepID=UPI001C0AB660|nr:DUF4355 domain-containing protein [Clostridium estertheticum]MBU3215867.1 hypothetical protein [Clostridium estertheticum]WAG57823.1 DUF4355 domain-containing protein [Clostridium estertheticum]
MEFTTEQQAEVTRLVNEATNTTKESYKEFMSKEDSTKFTQSETDKIRTEYSKQIKGFEDKIAELSPIAKTDSEKAIDARLSAVEERENLATSKEKLLNTSDMLKKQGLPTELAKYLQTVKAEDVETEITSLKAVFEALKVDNGYKPTNHKTNNESMTKDQFKKLNYVERSALFTSNPTLYSKLSK